MISQNQANKDSSDALFEEIAHLCGWLDDYALPLWLGAGFDHDLGLFHERLDMDGRPIVEIPRRLIVQCRQIGVYAYATLRGRLDAKERLKSLYERIRSLYHVQGSSGHWRYSVGANGKPADDRVDSYTLAFVLFALAWLYRLEPNDNYLKDADDILSVLDGPLSAEGGGVAVSLPPADNLLLQNPNMHLFEACLLLYEAAGRKKDLDRAQALARLFSDSFFDHQSLALPEQHLPGWITHDPSTNWYEPGHHFEWSWLFRQLERLGGGDHSKLIEILSERSLSEGIDHSFIVIEQVGLQNNFKKQSSRNWGICEFIKFCAAEYQEAKWRKDKAAEDLWTSRSLNGLRALKRTFLSTLKSGLWHDRVSEAGVTLTDYAPASSLYHIAFAIAEAERIFTRVVPQKPTFGPTRQKALFLDRDGVINIDIAYAHKPEHIEFVPGIFDVVRKANAEGLKVIVVTNQSGVARAFYSEKDVILLHEWMAHAFVEQGAKIDAFYHCPHFDGAISEYYRRENHFDRKPSPGMLKRASLEWAVDLSGSTLMGDKQSDIDAATAVAMHYTLVYSQKMTNLILE